MRIRSRFFSRNTVQSGQTAVEFALASTIFLMVVLGAIDFGRSIYVYSQLNAGVRDSARVAKVSLSGQGYMDYWTVEQRVRVGLNPETNVARPRPGLSAVVVNVTCSGACQSGDKVTIEAAVPFQAVTQDLLGISPFTLESSATVTLE